MPRPPVKPEDEVVETWESAIEGTVYVWIYNRREDNYIKQPVGGRSASKRLHITRDDRKYNQEQIPVENTHLDPFTNGSLRLMESATRDETLDTRYHLADEDLAQIFDLRDQTLFEEAIHDISSELVLRRLVAVGEKLATVHQLQTLKDLVQQRYPIGGSQRAVREMIEAGERIGATQI